MLRLPLRRARGRARAPGDVRHPRRGDDAPAADAARRGDHRLVRRRACADRDRSAGASRSALQALPEPARGRVRVDPRGADPRSPEARGCAQRPHTRAARAQRGGGRPPARDRLPGRPVDPARPPLRRRAAARARARGAGEDLGGGLRVALPGGVARGDREDDDRGRRRDRRGARARGRRDRVAGGPRRRLQRPAAAALEAAADRRARLRPRHALLGRGPRACWRRSRTTPRSRSSTGAP